MKAKTWFWPVIQVVLLVFFCNGCKKSVPEPDGDKIGTAANLFQLTPDYQPGTYRNMDKIFNTRAFRRGSTVFALPHAANPLVSVAYSPDGNHTYDINDFILRNNISGLLIIKNGQIVLERYALGNSETSKWTSFSVAKSITSTLIGMAVKDGKISNLHDSVTKYLPVMKGTAYEGVTVCQLLQMSSGVSWNEDYTDPASQIGAMFQVILNGQAGGIISLLSGLPRASVPGTKFLYSTGETFLESQVLKVALGGETMSGYLQRKLWSVMGMEADGYWILESPNGSEFGGGNVSMTLRDYGRFGMFILNNGIVNGDSLLPQGWVNEASAPAADSPQCGYGMLYSTLNNVPDPYYYPHGYGYNWWVLPDSPWGSWDHLGDASWWGEYAVNASDAKFTNLEGSFLAQGIYGQFIHINKKQNMVTVIWSAWPEPWIDPREYEYYCFINAAAQKLNQ